MSKRLLTDEQHNYFVNNCKGKTTKELSELLYKEFGITLSVPQIQGYKSHYGITNGVNTRFKKGEQSPYNETIIRDIGDSFVSRKDGYHYIKIGKNKWVRKHRYLYEQAHGVKLPSNVSVVFLDGNKDNLDINNLKAVDMRTKLMARDRHLFTSDKETTKTGLLISKLILKTGDKKKSFKKM